MSQEKGNGVLTEITRLIGSEDLKPDLVEPRRKRCFRFE
jgi:hypothetical protein